jgi:hypothetical protein
LGPHPKPLRRSIMLPAKPLIAPAQKPVIGPKTVADAALVGAHPQPVKPALWPQEAFLKHAPPPPAGSSSGPKP